MTPPIRRQLQNNGLIKPTIFIVSQNHDSVKEKENEMSDRKRVVNYALPLGEKAKEQIEKEIGKFEEVIIEMKLDLDKDLLLQVVDLIDRNADYIIPPAFGAAAYLMGMRNRDLQPIIWLKGENWGGTTRWVIGGVVRW
jgi:tRNA U54 and U55 pseudouridine synthase Pus10